MRENCTPGSVRGAPGNRRSYLDELNNLQHAIELYEKIGYSAEKIQELVAPQLQKLLQTHDDLLALKQLTEEGVILDAKVRKSAVYQEHLTVRGTDWQAEA